MLYINTNYQGCFATCAQYNLGVLSLCLFTRCMMHDAYLLSVVCPKETTGGFDVDLNIDHRGAGICPRR